MYSRATAPNSTRLETLLEPLLQAPCITYTSGLAALHATYVFLNPRVVSIGGGYHGSHGVLHLHSKLTGAKVVGLDCDADELDKGDVIHLETPINPTGKAYEIKRYAEKARSRGAWLLVDSTFAPPPLQNPFEFGADIVMHSATKYLGGHSDMLCGVLATRKKEWLEGMKEERTHLGSVLGSLEGWLGLRSLRTLGLRVERQSMNAERIVGWLYGLLRSDATDGDTKVVQKVVQKIEHASLQRDDMLWLKKQMRNGFGPVFALTMKSEVLARTLPSACHLFSHATSLGGIESLVEWRAMSDKTVDQALVRVSVGVEAWEDLRNDLLQAFRVLSEALEHDQRP